MKLKTTFDLSWEDQKLIAADIGYQGEAGRVEIEEWLIQTVQDKLLELRDEFAYIFYEGVSDE